jgi:uncharacterized protein YbaA (DUF1428 family)
MLPHDKRGHPLPAPSSLELIQAAAVHESTTTSADDIMHYEKHIDSSATAATAANTAPSSSSAKQQQVTTTKITTTTKNVKSPNNLAVVFEHDENESAESMLARMSDPPAMKDIIKYMDTFVGNMHNRFLELKDASKFEVYEAYRVNTVYI